MKRITVNDATENQIDWLVAKIEGVDMTGGLTDDERYSANPAHAYPIILREKIATRHVINEWSASRFKASGYGATPLIAAMRCFIVSRLGDKAEVPEELA